MWSAEKATIESATLLRLLSLVAALSESKAHWPPLMPKQDNCQKFAGITACKKNFFSIFSSH
jgi:hypothetical protein